MNVIKSTDGLTKRNIYDLTRSPEIKKMSENKGTIIDVDSYCLYQDVNGKGDEVTILSIGAKDGTVYATNSQTAIKEFEYILDLMDGEPFAVRVMTGTSKNGREYITVALA